MRKMILIVDDDEINLGLLTSILEDEYALQTAPNGRAALAKLGYYGKRISVVLLDLVMPGIDGFEVLTQMRQSAEMRSIPVVVVSGRDEREDGFKAVRYGAADYVTKPVEPELIRIKVKSAINKAENARLRAENDYFLLQRDEEAKYRTVLESTSTVVVEYDRLGGAYRYDPSISKHIAGNFDERRLWQILMSDMVADIMDVKAMQELVYQLANNDGGGSDRMTVRLKTPAGPKQWFRMQVFKQPGANDRGHKLILTFNNVNDEVLSAERLRFQAERDGLTGLYGRATFFEQAAGMIAAREPGCYVMSCFDIDQFKVINDQYGSDKGDQVLKRIADIVRDSLEPVGGIAGRISADNFVALYPVSIQGSGLLEVINKAVKFIDDSIFPLSFSVGRYLVADLALSPSAMYDRAALAKASIKGRYDVHIAWYDEAMRASLIREQKIVNEMKPALESGQFEVWLQPQYNHATQALIGAEALVRWRHPQKGIVAPGEFIPVFERNGFVYELDKYVWEQTCVLLRGWMDAGQDPLPVSVNISRYDLFREDLVKTITGLVGEYGIPLDMLRLEVTESAFAESTEQVVRIVKSLIDYGFTVEIDDFGSGYSSLNTLKDVPAQILKLDMRFLDNSEDAGRGGSVLESVARMAKWLGMAVIAEGVEKIEQADYLKSIGCTYVQGYLYARPMPAGEYEALAQGAGREAKLLALETVKNLDNNAFWDPQSMDTLIFNSYVGAACIMEYCRGHMELLRVSEKFVPMLGSDSMTVEDALKLDWKSHFAAESLAALVAAVQSSFETGGDVAGEYLILQAPGCPAKTWLRITLRVIASTGESYLVYCVNENITAQKELEAKERATSERLQFLNDTAGELLAQTDAVSGINRVLTLVRECFGSDRAFIFEHNYADNMCSFTYEACKSGVAPGRGKYGQFSLDRAWYWQQTFRTSRFLCIAAVGELGDDRAEEAEIMRALGAESALAVVLCYGGRNIGTLGVFNPTLHLDDYQDLRALADYVAIILTRRDLLAKIANDRQILQTMMDDTPGGFMRLRVWPDGGVATEYVNDNFCRMQGITREAIMAPSEQDALERVHPDDMELVRRTVAEMVATGETRSINYRLKHASGAYILRSAFGRVTRGDDDAKYLNVYYADLAE